MSINDFLNKIKDKLGIDTFVLLCLLIIILVALSSFGLGRLSIANESIGNKGVIITNKKSKQINERSNKIKEYVSSRNGKLYYTLNCSGVNRISKNNKIWFSSSKEAEEAGYSFSSSCNKKY